MDLSVDAKNFSKVLPVSEMKERKKKNLEAKALASTLAPCL